MEEEDREFREFEFYKNGIVVETKRQMSPYEINCLVLELNAQFDMARCRRSEIRLHNASVLNGLCGLMAALMRSELEGTFGLPEIPEEEDPVWVK